MSDNNINPAQRCQSSQQSINGNNISDAEKAALLGHLTPVNDHQVDNISDAEDIFKPPSPPVLETNPKPELFNPS